MRNFLRPDPQVRFAPPRCGVQQPRRRFTLGDEDVSCVTDSTLFADRSEDGEEGSNSTAPAPAFFRIRDVLRITALSRPTIYRRIAAGKFPVPVHLGGRACAWSRDALQTWINDPDNYRAQKASDVIARRPRGRPRKCAAA